MAGCLRPCSSKRPLMGPISPALRVGDTQWAAVRALTLQWACREPWLERQRSQLVGCLAITLPLVLQWVRILAILQPTGRVWEARTRDMVDNTEDRTEGNTEGRPAGSTVGSMEGVEAAH